MELKAGFSPTQVCKVSCPFQIKLCITCAIYITGGEPASHTQTI